MNNMEFFEYLRGISISLVRIADALEAKGKPSGAQSVLPAIDQALHFFSDENQSTLSRGEVITGLLVAKAELTND